MDYRKIKPKLLDSEKAEANNANPMDRPSGADSVEALKDEGSGRSISRLDPSNLSIPVVQPARPNFRIPY
jgi:hypothetical protein